MSVVSLMHVISTSFEGCPPESTLRADVDPAELDATALEAGQAAPDGQEKDPEEEQETKLFALIRVIVHRKLDYDAANELVPTELTLGSGRLILSSLFRPPRTC